MKGWCILTMPAVDSQQIISIAFPILIIVFFIIAIIMPQRKRDKAVKNMLNSLKAGDKVRTIGGLYGKIVKIDNEMVTLELGPDKVRIPFTRSAIASVDKSADNVSQEQLSADAAADSTDKKAESTEKK